jgi:hypothetical protein
VLSGIPTKRTWMRSMIKPSIGFRCPERRTYGDRTSPDRIEARVEYRSLRIKDILIIQTALWVNWLNRVNTLAGDACFRTE